MLLVWLVIFCHRDDGHHYLQYIACLLQDVGDDEHNNAELGCTDGGVVGQESVNLV